MAKSDVEIKLGLDSSEAEAEAKSAGKSIGDKAGSGVEDGLDSGSKSGVKKAASNIDSSSIKSAGESAGDKAGKGIGDGIGEGTKEGVKEAEKAVEGLGDGIETALGAIGIGAGVAGIFELVEQSAESSFSKVEAGAKAAGVAMENAVPAYEDFVGITGDAEQATEAVNNAFRLCQGNTEDLAEWTNIAAGAYATMGDSLPIENLTEAANETARTGVVVGGMADALNWATLSTDEWATALGSNTEAQAVFNAAMADGMSAEDAFNEALASCNDEQERGQLITETLSNIYSEAGQSYLDTNDAVVEYNKTQDELSRTLQDIGQTYMPLVTTALQWFVDNKDTLVPVLTGIAAAFVAMSVVSTISAGVTALQAAFEAVVPAIVAFNAALAANPILGVIVVLATLVAGLIYFFTQTEEGQQIWSNFTTFLGNAATTIQSALSQAAAFIQSAWSTLQSFMNGIPEKIKGAFSSLPSSLSSIFNSVKQGIQSKFEEAVNFVRNIPGQIKGIFSGAGSWLFESGASIINGLKNGINSAFNSAKKAVQDGLATLRSYFPFSPAKRGPFSGHGYTTYSGRAIMRDLGKGMTDGAKDAKLRAEDALASVQASFEAPISSRVSVAGATNNSRVYSVTFGDVTTGGDDRTAQAVERFFTDLGIIQRTGAY